MNTPSNLSVPDQLVERRKTVSLLQNSILCDLLKAKDRTRIEDENYIYILNPRRIVTRYAPDGGEITIIKKVSDNATAYDRKNPPFMTIEVTKSTDDLAGTFRVSFEGVELFHFRDYSKQKGKLPSGVNADDVYNEGLDGIDPATLRKVHTQVAQMERTMYADGTLVRPTENINVIVAEQRRRFSEEF